mgnify:FL=1
MTKQEKIEKLIQMEWEDFQKVNNEGGRASCQDDPETFYHATKPFCTVDRGTHRLRAGGYGPRP